ncbi:MAG: hypothetical protein QXE90_03735 [Candidatus Micrarchaeia archaeon]
MRFRDLNKRKEADKKSEKSMRISRETEENIIKERDETHGLKNEQKKNAKRLLFISGSIGERLRMLRLGEELGISFHVISDLDEIAYERNTKIDLDFDAIIISDEAFEKIDIQCSSDFINRLKHIHEHNNMHLPKIVLLTDFKQRFEAKCLHLKIDCVHDFLYKKIFKRENIEQIIKNLEESK